MKMFLLFLLLVNVSQHALAVLVEVNEGAVSVLLPCQYSGFIPEDPTVMWTHSDLNPKTVHLLREGGDDLRGQNQRYSGRTSVRSDALDSGDFSLTLRNPQLTDSSSYTCSISDGRQEQRLRDIQLQVKDQQVEVKVEEGSESVILPCKTTPDLPEDTRVEWTRSDRGLMVVHEYSNGSDHLNKQDGFYRERTKMNEDLLRTGDLSLTLKQPTQRDTGGYICTIYRDKDILRHKVVLQVKEPFPSWAKALLVLLVLLLVSGGLLFYFRQYFMSVYKVEVDSWVESVQLPCKTAVWQLKDAKVEWTDRKNRKVHVYQSGSDQPGEQDKVYRGRTKMKRSLLKTGDLSLTLKYPTDEDNSTCTCTISRAGNILKKKQVLLTLKVPQVEVDSDAKVEWMDNYSYNTKVHLYQNGSHQPEEQHRVYRDRTKINEDLLKTGDLSLTLKYPTDDDTKTYICSVYSREGNILMRKQFELKVRGPESNREHQEQKQLH
ncbi:butyrophilin-like protein 1 [Archocentrus centrarchus]|uniref:butyrophilin-like protein 1 n=1 Tax=Archocentrus centrarchus TaxID=63155 RepID=UPI0011E9FB46|nr:butyrophilin-like protein 1 [Archocentrus centrarchus]